MFCNATPRRTSRPPRTHMLPHVAASLLPNFTDQFLRCCEFSRQPVSYTVMHINRSPYLYYNTIIIITLSRERECSCPNILSLFFLINSFSSHMTHVSRVLYYVFLLCFYSDCITVSQSRSDLLFLLFGFVTSIGPCPTDRRARHYSGLR